MYTYICDVQLLGISCQDVPRGMVLVQHSTELSGLLEPASKVGKLSQAFLCECKYMCVYVHTYSYIYIYIYTRISYVYL